MIRYYLCTTTGNAISGFRPVGVANNYSWTITDGRVDPTAGVGKLLVRADVTPAQHTTLVGTVGVTYIPIEDLAGNPIDVGLTLGDIPATKRNNIKTILEAENIPTQGFQLSDNIDESMQKVAGRRFLMRQILGVDDWVEVLDSLVSAIAPARRQTIANKLQARGYDTSEIVGSDTVREAIRKLIAQR